MIYLDNAATSWPKPACVREAVEEAIEQCGNPGRGAHPLSNRASQVIFDCREMAASMFKTPPEGVIFTYSATYALNFAIKGLLNPGEEVLISSLSHNAVRRPAIAWAREQNGRITVYPYSPDPEELLRNVKKAMTNRTAMVISTHCSNICGAEEPVELLGAFCRRHGLHFVVDGAQSAGHRPIDMKKMNISALCLPGHKGLFGIQGVGMLLLGEELFGKDMKPIVEGGSGIRSLEVEMPMELPERLEAGTPGTPAIAGLLEGMRFVQSTGVEKIARHLDTLSAITVERLRRAGAVVYGVEKGHRVRGGVVSFCLKNHTPAEVGEALAKGEICVRSGLHCAPLAHQTMGSPDCGTVRVSFSPWNTVDEVDALMTALGELR